MSTYSIGEAAERSGFSPSALRYYEGIGLIEPSARSAAGYRIYDDRALARLALVARAKELGCSLKEIGDLVGLWEGDRCEPVQRRFHRLVTDKITDASRHIEEFRASAAQLQDAAGQLEGPAVDGPCDSRCSCLADGGADTPVALLVTDEPSDSMACTLPAEEVAGRLGEWRQILAHEVERRKTTDGRLRIELDTTVDLAALTRLVVAEQACCAFFSFAITVGPEGAGLEVGALAGAGAMVEQILGTVPAGRLPAAKVGADSAASIPP